jgi:hypothetical protein
MGQTDEWRGTGVWSGLSVKREGDENKDDKNKDVDNHAPATKSTDITAGSPN